MTSVEIQTMLENENMSGYRINGITFYFMTCAVLYCIERGIKPETIQVV